MVAAVEFWEGMPDANRVQFLIGQGITSQTEVEQMFRTKYVNLPESVRGAILDRIYGTDDESESNSVCAVCGRDAVGFASLCCEARIIKPSVFAQIKDGNCACDGESVCFYHSSPQR